MELSKEELQIMIACVDRSFASDIRSALSNIFEASMNLKEIHDAQLNIDEKLRKELSSY